MSTFEKVIQRKKEQMRLNKKSNSNVLISVVQIYMRAMYGFINDKFGKSVSDIERAIKLAREQLKASGVSDKEIDKGFRFAADNREKNKKVLTPISLKRAQEKVNEEIKNKKQNNSLGQIVPIPTYEENLI